MDNNDEATQGIKESAKSGIENKNNTNKEQIKITIIATVVATLFSTFLLFIIGFMSDAISSYVKNGIKNIAGTNNNEILNNNITDNVVDELKIYIEASFKPELEKYIDNAIASAIPNNTYENKNENESKPDENNKKNSGLIFVNIEKENIIDGSIESIEINEYAGLKVDDNNNDVIASDRETGKKYTAKNLISKYILMPYKENGQEVYFLGQFNKNYHWDGNCTINVYKDNRLILITEAVYDDGNLISYKQVSEDSKKSIEVWNISNRKRKGNKNTGSTSSYYKTKDLKKKNFTMENVKVTDIMDVKTFKKDYCTKQEGYYNGNTSEGRYNDNSRKAYLIKYNKKGIIEFFYNGKFVDGQPEDDTTQAWSIVPDEGIRCYVRQQGYFTNGHIDREKPIDKNFPLTQKDIDNCIKSLNVEKKYLKWDVSYFK